MEFFKGLLRKEALEATYIWQMTTKWGTMVIFFWLDFFMAFLAVSLHEEPKNTIKVFTKISC
jgi:hypothetical protein